MTFWVPDEDDDAMGLSYCGNRKKDVVVYIDIYI